VFYVEIILSIVDAKLTKGFFSILTFYFVNIQYSIIKILMSVLTSNITKLFQAVRNLYLHATLFFLFRSDA